MRTASSRHSARLALALDTESEKLRLCMSPIHRSFSASTIKLEQ